MLIPIEVANLVEVTLYCELCLPLLGLRRTSPLMHSATVSVCQDLVYVCEEHGTEVGVLVSDHGPKGRVGGPRLCLRVSHPQSHTEVK